jgi:hypothetical protein
LEGNQSKQVGGFSSSEKEEEEEEETEMEAQLQ